MFKRCLFCQRIMWPWQNRWQRVVGRSLLAYHPRCQIIYRDITSPPR